MSEHISRKELKQDKIKETFAHGAEAVISHGQFTAIVVTLVLAVALGWGGCAFISIARPCKPPARSILP